MLCIKPFVPRFGSLPFGCSVCPPCTINRRRLWAMRMLLESFKHGDSSFITLTYSNIPQTNPCRICKAQCYSCRCKEHSVSLRRQHYRNFLKNLRPLVTSSKIRYFLVGEYGEETQRPHFHAILFGVAPAIAGGLDGFGGLVRKAWAHGHTYVGDATVDSMQYVAGYVTKKMNHAESKCSEKCKHPKLNGREPEFSRMSLRPGIGALAVDDIARAMGTDAGLQQFIESGDVPLSLSVGRKSLPLARYLRRKLREKMGISPDAPKEAIQKYSLEMQVVYQEALKNPKMRDRCISRSDFWGRINRQKALNMGSKFKLFESAHKI